MVTEKNVLTLQFDDTKCGFGHFTIPCIRKIRQLHRSGMHWQRNTEDSMDMEKEAQQALFDENAEKAEEIYLEAEKCSK